MKINNKNSKLHPETGFASHFAELRGFGAARRAAGRSRVPGESPDYAPVAAPDAAGTMQSEYASLK
jgi:hypothetical protein